jgi:hypothetical protein
MARDRIAAIPQVKKRIPHYEKCRETDPVSFRYPLRLLPDSDSPLRIDMSTTLNHVALSRAQFAQASELADAGSTDLAHTHLLFAADHALLALEKIGAAPPDGVTPELRELDDESFEQVQALIDSYFARPASPPAPAIPMYGGANGALNARGAEAAARGLSRIGAAIKAAFRR